MKELYDSACVLTQCLRGADVIDNKAMDAFGQFESAYTKTKNGIKEAMGE